jgi:hypothetical protein
MAAYTLKAIPAAGEKALDFLEKSSFSNNIGSGLICSKGLKRLKLSLACI